jgi:hypothetical protein
MIRTILCIKDSTSKAASSVPFRSSAGGPPQRSIVGGIRNIGNTCYQGAALGVIFGIGGEVPEISLAAQTTEVKSPLLMEVTALHSHFRSRDNAQGPFDPTGFLIESGAYLKNVKGEIRFPPGVRACILFAFIACFSYGNSICITFANMDG